MTKCNVEGCNKKSLFNISGQNARYCGDHKKANMIDVITRRCAHPGCQSLSHAFDFEGGTGKYCGKHKIVGMINVKTKICAFPLCKRQPNYNIAGNNPIYCAKHKTDSMVDVKSKRCATIGCDLIPGFNTKGSAPIYCSLHKTNEMVDVKNSTCIHEGCSSVSRIFDFPGGKGRFCSKHKMPNMVNVKNTVCLINNCSISVSYGTPGHKPSHCAKHREKGMIRRPNARCLTCKNPAVWGTNWIPKHCEIHKTDDEENYVERECASCGLHYILDKMNTCENCNPSSWETARLAKQNALMNYLDSRNLTGSSTDTMIDNGVCGKERPDRIFDFTDKIVILECDENQHQERACLCEQTRMINIGQSFGGIPTYFIRFNPDDYSPENQNKIPELIAKRHKLCADFIIDIHNGRVELPKELVSAIYLYYDGWSTLAAEKWKSILKYEKE